MFLFLLLPLLWLVLGFIIISLFGKFLPIKNKLLKILLLSFLYSLLFGIGIVGASNAEPGFAFPAPIFLAGILDIRSGNEVKFIIRGTLYPFFFWWIFATFVIGIIHVLKK